MARQARLRTLAHEAADCQACDLWRVGTQTVFGQGPASAEVVLVGEQPGDHEDLAGEPFVGPAGRLLDDAMAESGLDRSQAFDGLVVDLARAARARAGA